MSRIALLYVVFIDILGQGLLLPILSSLLLDPSQDFLPKEVSQAGRELRYGVVLALFYLAWFFGAAFISKVSDYIGRKVSILICLVGAFVGYALTIVAIEYSSLILLIVGRFIGGFTAGNQPIAQAALVDEAQDDQQKAQFMGQLVAAVALGFIAGPLLTATLSSKTLMGDAASLTLPIYAAILLVLINIGLIVQFFRETLAERRTIDFGLSEVFLTLLRIRHHPITLRLAPVFFFAVMGFNGFFIFLNDFLIERFQFSTVQNSVIMIVLGATMGFISLFLVGPVFARLQTGQHHGGDRRHHDGLHHRLCLQSGVGPCLCADHSDHCSPSALLPDLAFDVFGQRRRLSPGLGDGRLRCPVHNRLWLGPPSSEEARCGSIRACRCSYGIGSCIIALVLIAVLWRGNADVRNLDPHKR